MPRVTVPWDPYRELMIEAEALYRAATKDGKHAEARAYKQVADDARREAIRLARAHYARNYAEIDALLNSAAQSRRNPPD